MNYHILLSGTILIVILSWFTSIKYKRYHGITRFFAFESVFILTLLNYNVWFRDPFSFYQILSWVCLTLSAYAAITGFILLRRKGKPEGNFENTSVLVSSGIYHFIRHPMYCSVFLLGTGIALKKPEVAQQLLACSNLIAIYFTARIEENEMLIKFGDTYRNYMKQTKMFIPYIF